MINKRIKTSVILKTLAEIQTNYDEDSLEYLVLEKSKILFMSMNWIRCGLSRTKDYKPIEEKK